MSTYLGRTVTVLEALGAAGGTVPSTATVDADVTAVTADVGVLVADGATPTQAHVTTLNGHWTTLVADWATLKAAQAKVSGTGINSTDVFETIRNADGSYSKVPISTVT